MRRLVCFVFAVALCWVGAGAARAGGAPCSAGSSSPNGIEPCAPCEEGTFAPNPGATECLQCAIGTYAASSGSASCALCDPGSFAAQPGAAACDPCAPGTFVDYAGAPACLACAPGYAAEASGQTFCTLCSAGTFAAQPASARCEPCAPGTFTDFLGAAACVACSPGTFSTVEGASSAASCQLCPAGRFASEAGSTACAACPPNSFQPSTGAATCLACACDDEMICTRDACDATSGVCSAPAVAGCTARRIEFSGSVTYVDERLVSPVVVGDPVTGQVQIDPEAPDHTPLDPVYGDYLSGLYIVDVSFGTSPQLLVQSIGTASVFVQNDGINGDRLVFESTEAEDGLYGPTFGAVPDGTPSAFRLSLLDAGATALASDALPGAGVLSAFPVRSALFELSSPTLGNLYLESTDLVSAPEPGAIALGLATLASLAALRRR